MKKFILIGIMIMLTAPAWGQPRCMTSMFEQAKKDLHQKYGRPHNNQPITNDITLHEVGDTMTFWNWDLSIMPPQWILVPATCRAVTEHAYVFVADDQWNVHMDSADVAQVAYYWEEGTYNDSTYGIYELNTVNFGLPPDELDDDDHIYIFYSELGSYQGSVFDGYFSVFNEYTEEEAQGMGGHSNEVEMFYMSCHPGDPVSPIRISVLAHEFEHMIHWAADPNEESWVDEGCAEYAMLLFGMPDPLVSFPNNPNNDLTAWNNEFADYIKTFMFMTYLSDHYGGAETIRAIVQEQQNSVNGVQMALINMGYTQPFESIFLNWAVANFHHGRGGDQEPYPDSTYLYFSIDPPEFRVFEEHHHYDYPCEGVFINQKWATTYLRFENLWWLWMWVNNTNNLNSGFGWIDSLVTGSIIIWTEIGEETMWDESNDNNDGNCVVVVCGLGEGESYHFDYWADIWNDVDENPSIVDNFALDQIYPNPFNQNTLIRFSSPANSSTNLEIYDIAGRLVRNWQITGNQNTGEIIWDGKNSDGQDVVSGIYLFKLSDGENSQIVKGTLLK